MTKQEFIDKWSTDSEEYNAMEFDLISVIRQAEQDEMEALIHERYKEEEVPQKAYCECVGR